jgi:hypothetical protein
MSHVQPATGAPERIGKLIGTVLAGLVVLAILVIMARQFA